MRRTPTFDSLESRKLLTLPPVWDPVTGYWGNPPATAPTTPADIGALTGAYTVPLWNPPPLAVSYPFMPAPYDILHNHQDINTSP